MKKYFVVSIILSLFLLLSCKDNTMNNPVSPNMNNVQKSADNTKTGEIKLDQILVVPGITETYYQLKGTISYSEDLFLTNLSTSTTQPDINLDLSINGKLYNTDKVNHNSWRIQSSSDQELYVSLDGIKLLHKAYQIEGRKDGLELVCTYLLTTDNVRLSNVQLSFSDNKIN